MDYSGMIGVKEVTSNDTFRYNCTRCGECCHNVKDSVMLSTMDLFRLAKHLSLELLEVAERFTDPLPITDYNFPILMTKIRQPGDVCVFYQNGSCTIQAAKPLVCRLYPLNIGPGSVDRLSYYIVSQKPHHFTGKRQTIKEYMKPILSLADVDFMSLWYYYAAQFGKLMNRVPSDKRETLLPAMLLRMYFLYDVENEFMPQYVQNMEALVNEILRRI